MDANDSSSVVCDYAGESVYGSSTEAGEYREGEYFSVDPLANAELIRLRAENKILTATNHLGENLALATEKKHKINAALTELTSKFKCLIKETVEARDAEVLTNRTCLRIIEDLKVECLRMADLSAKDKLLLEQRITVLSVELSKKNEIIDGYSNEVRATVASKASTVASMVEAHSAQKEAHAKELKQMQVQIEFFTQRNAMLQSNLDSELKLVAPMKDSVAALEAKDHDAQIAIDKLRRDLAATRKQLQKSQNEGKSQREQINNLKSALTAVQQENTALNLQNTDLKDRNEELANDCVGQKDNISSVEVRMRSIFEKIYFILLSSEDKAAIFSMSSTMPIDRIITKIESELPVMISDLDRKVAEQNASINDLSAAIAAKNDLVQKLEGEAIEAEAEIAALEHDVSSLKLTVVQLNQQITITNNSTNIDPLLRAKMERLQQSLLDAQELSRDLHLSVTESEKSTALSTTEYATSVTTSVTATMI